MSDKAYNLYGLTGPTGAGKSLAGKVFAENGFAVVDADKIAHDALKDAECTENLRKAFTDEILDKNGSINRPALAKAAFSSKENTELLNSITHPVIIRLSLETFRKLAENGFKNIIFDAPTLIEAEMDTMCKKVISVLSPVELRLQRIMERDNITEQQALARISAQHPDSFYESKSDYVIMNDSSEKALTERTTDIIKELL